MLAIIATLAIDYATILRIEVFAEMRAGRSLVEALANGNALLTAIGVLISIVGVAAVLYLAFGRRTWPARRDPTRHATNRTEDPQRTRSKTCQDT